MNVRIYSRFFKHIEWIFECIKISSPPSHPWPTQPDLDLSLFLEEPDGFEVFVQETDKEVYFYLNALDDSDKESDDTEDDDNYVGGLIL